MRDQRDEQVHSLFPGLNGNKDSLTKENEILNKIQSLFFSFDSLVLVPLIFFLPNKFQFQKKSGKWT